MNRNDNRLKVLPVIWMALLATVVVYGAIAWLATRGRAVEPGSGLSNVVVIALFAAGFGALVASLVIPKIIAAAGNATTPNAPAAYRPITEAARSAIIIRWALTEAIAIFGLVGTILTGDWVVFVPLGVVGFFGILIASPTEDRLRGMAGPR